MMRPARSILMLCLVTASQLMASAAEDRPVQDWPSYRGPNDDFSAPYAGQLIDDLNQARLLWTSEETNLGWGKYPISGWGGMGARPDKGLPGGNGSPIVYDGRVYVALFRPSGEAVDQEKVANGRAKHGETFRADFYRIEAEDIVLAMDATTGKTVWKQVIPGGLSRPTVKRSGWGVTPVAADGRIFTTTTMGRVYAFDAVSGEVLWQGDNGAPERCDEQKAKAMASQRHDRGSDAMNAGMTIIGGVLLVPDFMDGIAALDPATGRQLWYRPNVRAGRSVPAIWRDAGKEWILVGSSRGELRLLHPLTGEEVWTVEGLCPLHFNLTVAGDQVFVIVPDDRPAEKKNRGVWAAYTLSPQGATCAWTTGHETEHGGDAGPTHIVVARDGVVFLGLHISGPTAVVDQASGETLQLLPGLGNLVACLWADRLVIRSESDHDADWRWFTWEHNGLRERGRGWRPPYVAGYTTPLITPFVGGVLFQRCPEDGGTIRCYDLRKP